MARSDLRAESIPNDDGIFRIVDKAHNGVGLLEALSGRYLVFYTLLPSEASDKLTNAMVAKNPMLDHLWLSSQTFQSMWNHVLQVNNGSRYGKITFEHESLFEVAEDGADFEYERRASRFSMVDRISVIDAQMEPLSESYAPLASITHLRIPSSDRGGHDVYYNGKVTNRSGGFLGHRASLLDIVEMYSNLTNAVEDKLWTSGTSGNGGLELEGAVAELVFSTELPEEVFRRWMVNMFNNRRNRFRISGFATWLNDHKVHANAIDQHLWQPLVMELTPKRVVAILPEGTCGNTINRLVSNIQRFVDPKVQAYIGDVEYSSLVPSLRGITVA
jgi:hypothetical protein